MLRDRAAQLGEVRQMGWADVPDIDAGWWTIPAEFSKNGLSHRVWLPLYADGTKRSFHEIQQQPRRWWKTGVPKTACSAVRWLFGMPETHRCRGGSKSRRPGSIFLGRTIYGAPSPVTWRPWGSACFTIGRILNHVETSCHCSLYDRHSYDAREARRARGSGRSAWARSSPAGRPMTARS